MRWLWLPASLTWAILCTVGLLFVFLVTGDSSWLVGWAVAALLLPFFTLAFWFQWRTLFIAMFTAALTTACVMSLLFLTSRGLPAD